MRLLVRFNAILLLSAALGTAFATDRHVSEKGSDSAGGDLMHPLKTIQHCASLSHPGDRCIVRAGTYREHIVPQSGITIEAYMGETAVVSGTERVLTWKKKAGGVFTARLSLPTLTGANQLFSAGKMLPEARWPHGGELLRPAWATMGPGTVSTSIHDVQIPDGDLTGASIHFLSGNNAYAQQSAKVISSGNKVIGLDFRNEGTCPDLCPKEGGRYYLFGTRTFLREPGEWFYEPADATLYLQTEGTAPSLIEVKVRDVAFDLRGKSHVTISGLKLFATTIVMDDKSADNVVERIEADYMSHAMLLPQPGLPNDVILSDGPYDVVASLEQNTGIILDGTRNTIRDSTLNTSAGNGIRVRGSHNVVENNLIHDMGYAGSYATAISLSGDHQRVLYNTIYRTGRDGITVDYHVGGKSFPDNQIIGNRIYQTSMMNLDSAGIYACCDLTADGTVISDNWISDGTKFRKGYQPSAIYLDNSSGGFLVARNVLWNTPGAGIHLNGDGAASKNNTIRDNTVFANKAEPDDTYSIFVQEVRDGAGSSVTHNFLYEPPRVIGLSDTRFVIEGNIGLDHSIPYPARLPGCNFTGCESKAPPEVPAGP